MIDKKHRRYYGSAALKLGYSVKVIRGGLPEFNDPQPDAAALAAIRTQALKDYCAEKLAIPDFDSAQAAFNDLSAADQATFIDQARAIILRRAIAYADQVSAPLERRYSSMTKQSFLVKREEAKAVKVVIDASGDVMAAVDQTEHLKKKTELMAWVESDVVTEVTEVLARAAEYTELSAEFDAMEAQAKIVVGGSASLAELEANLAGLQAAADAKAASYAHLLV